MTDTPRCEPPPELRGVDGWHWVQLDDAKPECHEWIADTVGIDYSWWNDAAVGGDGWRYLAPATPPAEVDALRAELAEWREIPGAMGLHPDQPAITVRHNAVALRAERDTIRATVAGLVEALEECATDLSDYVQAAYSHPAHAHRLERDMAPVVRARAAIARAKGDGT